MNKIKIVEHREERFECLQTLIFIVGVEEEGRRKERERARTTAQRWSSGLVFRSILYKGKTWLNRNRRDSNAIRHCPHRRRIDVDRCVSMNRHSMRTRNNLDGSNFAHPRSLDRSDTCRAERKRNDLHLSARLGTDQSQPA